MRHLIIMGVIAAAVVSAGLLTTPPAGAGGPAAIERAAAVLHPTEGNSATGTVYFTQVPGGVRISGDIEGLKPGKHGFHIHELGDCSAPDATSAGGHYNPDGNPHAGPDQENRHMGDLGNLTANDAGRGRYDKVDGYVVLNGARSVVGRAVVVHGREDDLTSQPSGAAGPRVACGVIGISAQ